MYCILYSMLFRSPVPTIYPKIISSDVIPEEVGPSPAKRMKFSSRRSVSVTPEEKKLTRNVPSHLETPVVKRKTPRRSDVTPPDRKYAATTPQSILKVSERYDVVGFHCRFRHVNNLCTKKI